MMTSRDVFLIIIWVFSFIGFLGAFTSVPAAVDSIWSLVGGIAFFNGDTEVTGENVAGSFCLDNNCVSDWSQVNQSGGTPFVYSNYFNQVLNTSSDVRFNRLGINVAPNANYRIYFEDLNVMSGVNTMYFNVRQNQTLYAPLSFVNRIIRPSGNPIAQVVVGTVATDKDTSGVQTMTAQKMNIGSSDVQQTQGTRNYNGYQVVATTAFTTGGTVNTVGFDYSNSAGFLTGGTLTQYGARLVKSTNSDFGTGTINAYGIYLSGWNKGASEDSSWGIYDVNGNWKTGGSMQANDYYSGDGSQGYTHGSSVYICTATDCSTYLTCGLKDGLLTACS